MFLKHLKGELHFRNQVILEMTIFNFFYDIVEDSEDTFFVSFENLDYLLLFFALYEPREEILCVYKNRVAKYKFITILLL